MARRPASSSPAPPGTAADRQADGRDPAWWPLYVTGGDATAGYTGYEVWRTTSTVEKQGGRTLTDANPGFPLVPGTTFAAGDYALVRSGPGTGGLEWELVPVAGSWSGDGVTSLTGTDGITPATLTTGAVTLGLADITPDSVTTGDLTANGATALNTVTTTSTVVINYDDLNAHPVGYYLTVKGDIKATGNIVAQVTGAPVMAIKPDVFFGGSIFHAGIGDVLGGSLGTGLFRSSGVDGFMAMGIDLEAGGTYYESTAGRFWVLGRPDAGDDGARGGYGIVVHFGTDPVPGNPFNGTVMAYGVWATDPIGNVFKGGILTTAATDLTVDGGDLG